ncbi:DNA-binding MarR family transcriptional regulator [Catenulispora sp. MAP12-49]|uniref:MarR family winged helix-turn-helix transcriptional regulator n=1 Tax=Catenulispora sp. MAP12-49 TaxID=3156302 RepID=UPI003516C777
MHLPAELPEPETEHQRLVLAADLALLGLAERLRQHWTRHAAAVGLSNAQIKVLLLLEPSRPQPMRALAVSLDYDTSNLSSLVDRLERRGAVERRPDAGDRRVKALVLTPEGLRLRETFWRALTADPGPMAPLDVEQLRTLVGVLETAAD